jgi:hypothetical protein
VVERVQVVRREALAVGEIALSGTKATKGNPASWHSYTRLTPIYPRRINSIRWREARQLVWIVLWTRTVGEGGRMSRHIWDHRRILALALLAKGKGDREGSRGHQQIDIEALH